MSKQVKHGAAYCTEYIREDGKPSGGGSWISPPFVRCTGKLNEKQYVTTWEDFVSCPECIALAALPKDTRPTVDGRGRRVGYKRARR